mgnify:CR=1 FL=1
MGKINRFMLVNMQSVLLKHLLKSIFLFTIMSDRKAECKRKKGLIIGFKELSEGIFGIFYQGFMIFPHLFLSLQ